MELLCEDGTTMVCLGDEWPEKGGYDGWSAALPLLCVLEVPWTAAAANL